MRPIIQPSGDPWTGCVKEAFSSSNQWSITGSWVATNHSVRPTRARHDEIPGLFAIVLFSMIVVWAVSRLSEGDK